MCYWKEWKYELEGILSYSKKSEHNIYALEYDDFCDQIISEWYNSREWSANDQDSGLKTSIPLSHADDNYLSSTEYALSGLKSKPP